MTKDKSIFIKNIYYMLAYAFQSLRPDEEQYPDNTYRMSGNRISVKTLDLNQRFEEIREQLNGIAELGI